MPCLCITLGMSIFDERPLLALGHICDGGVDPGLIVASCGSLRRHQLRHDCSDLLDRTVLVICRAEGDAEGFDVFSDGHDIRSLPQVNLIPVLVGGGSY